MGREQLHNPLDTATGLTKEQRDAVVKYYKENVFDIEHKNDPEKPKVVSVPAKYYLKETARRPILMLYYVELSENELTDETQKIKENFDNNEVVIFESPNSFCIQRLQSTIIDIIFQNTKVHIRRRLG